MSDFSGMEDLLQDFLTEASELLSDVDNKLVELEKRPDDKNLLNVIFRGFHTIKGGAGFLNVDALVNLCHRTENLFDKLRNGELKLTPELMDAILAATGVVRDMFGSLSQSRPPAPADAALLTQLDDALEGRLPSAAAPAPAPAPAAPPAAAPVAAPASQGNEPDWVMLHAAITGTPMPAAKPASAPVPA
ncbi:MAG: Hpt domain-containing protein, partial [Chitinimonas sp.]|nr:Hpt domain-containing protein [Chitinimonas sp.]